MNYWLLAIGIIYGASAVFGAVHSMHMLQQNSYFPSRYFSYLKKNYKSGLFLNLIAFIWAVTLTFCRLYYFSLALGVLTLVIKLLSARKNQKKSVKPLVFTKRIKRMFGALTAVFAILSAVAFVFDIQHFIMPVQVLCYCAPVSVLLVWAICFPIEKCYSLYYIRDAKNILKSYDRLKVIGVTGSFGKTSVKNILKELLSEKYNAVATPQSYNTPMGVVRTVREYLRRDTEIFVCEMGAKNKGDIKELCDIASPDFGIITSVGEQHLETFGSLDAVASTKFELADACNESPVFVNFDSPAARANAKNRNVISYGTTSDCDYYAINVSCDRQGSSFTVVCKESNKKIQIKTKLLGMYNVVNITGAVAIADYLSVPANDITFAASRLIPTAHRLEPKPFICGSVMIDDAYNSNPEGCLGAVEVLSTFSGMKKVIITPGLVELGEREEECNRNLAKAAAKVCDTIIIVGKKRAELLSPAVKASGFNTENLFEVASFAQAVEVYKNIADSNTVVLVENDLPDNYLN